MICFKCEQVIGTILNPNIAYDATIFESSGTYGSTITDNLEDYNLRIYVCDECLTKNQDKVFTTFTPPPIEIQPKIEKWAYEPVIFEC